MKMAEKMMNFYKKMQYQNLNLLCLLKEGSNLLHESGSRIENFKFGDFGEEFVVDTQFDTSKVFLT